MAVFGEGDSANVVSIGDTRAQACSAAVRAKRGYQIGVHYWAVQVHSMSDWSYIGFVSEEWDSLRVPVGRAAHSWGVASSGSVFSAGKEVSRLPQGYGEGSVVGILLRLAGAGKRTASFIIDGRRCDNLFTCLPRTVFPAVSNMRSPAKYSLMCAAGPPSGDLLLAVKEEPPEQDTGNDEDHGVFQK